MIKFLTSEIGYGIACSLLIIIATHFLKQLFKSTTARKRYTPLITLALGFIASIAYYLLIEVGTLDFGKIQAYVSISVYGMEMAIAATGVYITVKRVFGKNTEDDVTVEELFKTAEEVLPQGLLLISNFTGGDITTTETLYNKIKAEVKEGLKEKRETIDQVIGKITTLLSGWTNNSTLDIPTQSKLLVQSIKVELDAAEKAEEQARLAEEAKLREAQAKAEAKAAKQKAKEETKKEEK